MLLSRQHNPPTTEETMLAEARTSNDIHSTRVLSLDSSGRIMDWM